MDLGISKVINEGNGNAIIYTALIASVLANCTPTVADGLYFWLQQKWKADLEDGKITPEQYWTYDILNYYTITAGYYVLIFLVMLSLSKNSYSNNSKILLALIAGGVIIGVGFKNVQKDKEIEELRSSTQKK